MQIQIEIDGRDLTKSQRAYLTAREPRVLLSGGYGSGKTLANAIKVLSMVTINPGVPGMLLAPNWRTMWAVVYRRLIGLLRRTLRPSEIPRVTDKQGECYIDFWGTPVYLRSAHNVDGYDGLDIGWALLDEARYMSRHAWDVCQGRVRQKCTLNQIAIATTPQMGWLSDEFDSGLDGRRLILAPTKDNAHNLSPGYIDGLKQSYSPRMHRALLDGIFTILEGAVYEALDTRESSEWIVDFSAAPQSSYFDGRPVYLAVDPGFRRSSWVWIVEHEPKGHWVVFDEMIADGRTDAQCVTEVNRRGWPIDEIWCDPAAGAVQSYEGASTLQSLRAIKTRAPKPIRVIAAANREIVFGVDKLRMLLGDPDAGTPIRIRFTRRLLDIERGKERGVVRDLASYRYPESRDGRPLSDAPLKDGVHDHGCDAMRYWGVGRCLVEPWLRNQDPALRARQGAGWRVAE